MKHQVDKLDKEILNCLYEDVRVSNRKIAAALKVSEGTVRARIGRMQAGGVVRFTATLDASILYQPVSGFIGINIGNQSADQVCRALVALPELNFVAKMLGRFDIFCSFLLHNHDELAELLQIKIPAVTHVKSSESIQVIQVYKFDRRWSVLGLSAGSD